MCEEELDFYCCTINGALESLYKSQKADRLIAETYFVDRETLNAKLQDGTILSNVIRFFFPQCEEALKGGFQTKHMIADVIEKYLGIQIGKEVLTDFLLVRTSLSTNKHILWVVTRHRYLGEIDFFKHAAALLDFVPLRDALKYHGEKLLIEWIRNVCQGQHQELFRLEAILTTFSVLFPDRNRPTFQRAITGGHRKLYFEDSQEE